MPINISPALIASYTLSFTGLVFKGEGNTHQPEKGGTIQGQNSPTAYLPCSFP